MTPAFLVLPDVTRGDTWEGVPNIGPITIDGVPPPYPVQSARMMYRRTPDSVAIGYALATTPLQGSGTITIAQAANWQFVIPKQVLPLGAGDWVWDLEMTDTQGTVYTFLTGTQRVRADSSRS